MSLVEGLFVIGTVPLRAIVPSHWSSGANQLWAEKSKVVPQTILSFLYFKYYMYFITLKRGRQTYLATIFLLTSASFQSSTHS